MRLKTSDGHHGAMQLTMKYADDGIRNEKRRHASPGKELRKGSSHQAPCEQDAGQTRYAFGLRKVETAKKQGSQAASQNRSLQHSEVMPGRREHKTEAQERQGSQRNAIVDESKARKSAPGAGTNHTQRSEVLSVLKVSSPSSSIQAELPHRGKEGRFSMLHPRYRWLDEVERSLDERTIIPGLPDKNELDFLYENLQRSTNGKGNKPTSSTQVLQQHRECVVCGDARGTRDFPTKPPTAACEHQPHTCSDCLARWISSEVDTKATEGIKCSECPQVLTYNDILRAASPATFARFDKLTIRAAVGSLPNFAWCLSPYCDAGQENVPNANFMECRACGYRQCLSHRMPWHEDETCELYDYRVSGQQARDEEQRRYSQQRRREQEKRDEERKTEAMLDSVSKTCPNPRGCGWRIQKISGCDHMTCGRCRWEFCWLCLASQIEINRAGNSAHRGSCPHYR